MDFKINFNLDNDMFRENLDSEVLLILEDIVSSIKAGLVCGVVHDINGNKIGQWEFTE